MKTSHELWITNSEGARITDGYGRSLIVTAIRLFATKEDGAVGVMELILPADFDASLLRPNNMVQVWRQPEGGSLELFNVYFVLALEYRLNGGELTLSAMGLDSNDLARRRFVAAYEGTATSKRTDTADNLMKDFVNLTMVAEAWGPAAGDRDYANLTIEPDLDLGPILFVEGAWQNVLEMLTKLQDASRQAGTEIFWRFDIASITSSSISFVFRTQSGQPATDLTPNGVMFSPQRGNLDDIIYREDHSQEVNYVFGLGQGQEVDQEVAEAGDSTRYGASVWAWSEGTVTARSDSEPTAVQDAADAALIAGRPKITFTAKIIDTPWMRFGIDWNWGCKIRVAFLDKTFDAIVKSVAIEVEAGNETVSASLEYRS